MSTDETENWLNRFASVMNLKYCDNNTATKLIFVSENHSKDYVYNIIQSFYPNSDLSNLQIKFTFRELQFLKFWYNNIYHDVICELKFDPFHDIHNPGISDIWKMSNALHPVYDSIQDAGGLAIHSALIKRDDYCVLISAPGGTGKTTCCQRIPLPWKALCDDESLIVIDKNLQYMVHPIPSWYLLFNGVSDSWDVQQYYPLKAIFFLEQSTSDGFSQIGQGEASALISDASLWIRLRGWKRVSGLNRVELRKSIFHNSCKIAKTIPAFRLKASKNGKFWEAMEKALESI